MNCKYSLENLDFSVEVADIQSKCRYHKKKATRYISSAMLPAGLCKELFYDAYPSCLSVLYSGIPVELGLRKEGIKEAFCSCPVAGGVKVRVEKEEILPPILRALKEIAEEFLKRYYRAFDLPLRRVIIEIIEKGPCCPKNYKRGMKFEFNIDKKQELCPAGFSSIYPYLKLLKTLKAGEDNPASPLFIHCPDYTGVTYSLNGAGAVGFNHILCRNSNSDKRKIRIKQRGREKVMGVQEILPANFCIWAFHSIYPYMHTLYQGGWFNWVNHNEDVIVNCPARCGVAMYVKAPRRCSSGGSEIEVEIMKEGPDCYKRYSLGRRFHFGIGKEEISKYEILYRAIPCLVEEIGKDA